MAAPQHLIDLAKRVHSDTVRQSDINGEGFLSAVETADELVCPLEQSPVRPVSDFVGSAIVDLVAFLHESPQGFRVGGVNGHDALNGRIAEWLRARSLVNLPEGRQFAGWFEELR